MAPDLAARLAPEDLLQETLLEAARKVGAFEPQGPAAFYSLARRHRALQDPGGQRARHAVNALQEETLRHDPAQSQTQPERPVGATSAMAGCAPPWRGCRNARRRRCDSATWRPRPRETAAALECSEPRSRRRDARAAELAAHLDLAGL